MIKSIKFFFQFLSFYFKTKLNETWEYRVIIIGLVVMALPLWYLGQGQDLLLNTNMRDASVVSFFLIITLIAFLNWHLTKLFFNPDKRMGNVIKELKQFREGDLREKNIARFFGVATFLLPMGAVFNELNIIKLLCGNAYLITLIAFLVHFIIIKKQLIEKGFNWSIKNNIFKPIAISLITIVLILETLLRCYFLSNDYSSPDSLVLIGWNLFVFSLLFLVFVTLRTKIPIRESIKKIPFAKLLFYTYLFFSFIFVLVNIFPSSIDFFYNIIYVVIKFFRSFYTDKTENSKGYLALPLLYCGTVFFMLLSTYVMILSKKYKTNFILLIFIIGIVLSLTIYSGYHELSYKYNRNGDTVKQTTNLDNINNYFDSWLRHREAEITKYDSLHNDCYPVFIVNAYGGGVRASAFTNFVLTYLDSAFQHSRNKKPFEHYVFSISGASGGTIGAAVQLSFLRKVLAETKEEKDSVFQINNFKDFYTQNDFLSSVLVTNLGRDVLAAASGRNYWDDRAKIQAKTWADNFKNYFKSSDYLNDNFFTFWKENEKYKYELPLLFSNTLNVDDGAKYISSPVIYDNTYFPNATPIKSILPKGSSISLITAAFLSARFPFVTPTGSVNGLYHFMDGGGHDNSGAATSESIFRNITCKQDTLFDRLRSKIKFYFISIGNSPVIAMKEKDKNKPKKVLEILNPLTGLINSATNGNATDNNLNLKYKYSTNGTAGLKNINTDYIYILPDDDSLILKNKEPIHPVLPLGWQISGLSLDKLITSVTKGDSAFKKIIQLKY